MAMTRATLTPNILCNKVRIEVRNKKKHSLNKVVIMYITYDFGHDTIYTNNWIHCDVPMCSSLSLSLIVVRTPIAFTFHFAKIVSYCR